MEIKPKANIGDKVNIVKGIFVQTTYGWNVRNLFRRSKGFSLYQVYDIEVTLSLKTGKIKYKYLIGTTNPENAKWFDGGWVSEEHIELVSNEQIAI